ncbi:MAG: helix-hairpin-helix domain-containing protein [Ruthenibacterium lactatiformans]
MWQRDGGHGEEHRQIPRGCGRVQTRRELLKVPKLGPKAFEQCAGFCVCRARKPAGRNGRARKAMARRKSCWRCAGFRPQTSERRRRGLEQQAKRLGHGKLAAELGGACLRWRI